MERTTPAKRDAQIIHAGQAEGDLMHSPDLSGMMNAEIDRQIATAKKYPRSIELFRSNVRALATLNEDIAEACMFALPRGGKIIEGPSVRFAEIAVSQWGNCRVGSQIIGEDENYVKALGIFWDLQSNSAIGFEVRRSIRYGKEHRTKAGQRFDADMIGVTGNAAASIALRNASLRGVPKAFWNDLYLEAVACAKGSIETLANRRAKAVENFKRFGVTLPQICATLGVAGLSEIGLDQLAQLRGFWTAITQEERDPEEIFKPVVQAGAAKGLQSSPARDTPAAASSAGADAQAADGRKGRDVAQPADTIDKETGEIVEREPSELEQSIAGHLLDCKTLADCDGVGDLFADEIARADEETTNAIIKMVEARKALLARSDDDDFPGDRP